MDQKTIAALVDGSGEEGYSNVRIFGRRLRKFSLWHKFLLRAINSPFITKKPVTLFDLTTAIGVCSLAYPSSDVRRPRLIPHLLLMWILIRELARVILIPKRWRKKKSGEENAVQRMLRQNVEKFLEYTADYLQEPEYAVIPPDTDGKYKKPREPRGAGPSELEQLSDLITWTKWDDKKIWNLPLGYANWLRVFAARDKGADISFVTEREKEWQKHVPDEWRWRT